ncbi:MAG: YtxH domain-containing protein [Candidatus Saccharimonadales bacterium]
MKKDTAKKFAIGTIFAAVAGYVAGLLTAPQSGKETRQDIKDKASEGYAAAEKELKKLHTELNDLINEASDALSKLKGKSGESLQHAIETSQAAKQKARELLSSLHDGEAEDKDLQKAITDASQAIERLKEFLTK